MDDPADERRLAAEFREVYPLDAAFDTLADAPAEIRANKRYQDTATSPLPASPRS